MDIKDMTLKELKSLWYDEFKLLKIKENNLSILANEIEIKEKELQNKKVS